MFVRVTDLCFCICVLQSESGSSMKDWILRYTEEDSAEEAVSGSEEGDTAGAGADLVRHQHYCHCGECIACLYRVPTAQGKQGK